MSREHKLTPDQKVELLKDQVIKMESEIRRAMTDGLLKMSKTMGDRIIKLNDALAEFDLVISRRIDTNIDIALQKTNEAFEGQTVAFNDALANLEARTNQVINDQELRIVLLESKLDRLTQSMGNLEDDVHRVESNQ